jgi:hypothetical protein
MNKRVLAGTVASTLAAIGVAFAGMATLKGSFALQGGVAKTTAHLDAMAVQRPLSAWKFDFWLSKGNSQTPITGYELDMTRPMHVIVIGNDFTTFVHEHPTYAGNGHFTMTQTFPKDGTYYLYFDSRPMGLGQQVFRFKIDAGTPNAVTTQDLSERSRIAYVDGYSVALSGLALRAGSETSLQVHITKGGSPATDIHPYLQALAHVVLIDADDLSYIHVHPVPLAQNAPATTRVTVYSGHTGVVPADMLLRVTAREAGTYKLWFQFRGGSSLHVASFVLTAT